MSRNTLLGSELFSYKYCAFDKIISLGLKRSIETDISKIAVPTLTNFLAHFPRIIDCDNPLETIYMGTPGVLTISMEGIGSIL